MVRQQSLRDAEAAYRNFFASLWEWTCTACCTLHDRDHNTAINVELAAGLAASSCGAPVRPGAIPAQREETGSHGFPTEPRAATRHRVIEKARILGLQSEEQVKAPSTSSTTNNSGQAIVDGTR
nr:hypothetical protein [Streptomyces sp. b94]